MRKLLVMLAVILLAACGKMPQPVYQVAANSDLNHALKNYGNIHVVLDELTHDKLAFMPCGEWNGISSKDAGALVDFIKETFNDEFKAAGVYGTGPESVHLTGNVEQLKTSIGESMFAPDGAGGWLIAIKLRNSARDKIMKSMIQHDYDAGAGIGYSCDTTMKNFSVALHRLIENTVIDSDFKELVGVKR